MGSIRTMGFRGVGWLLIWGTALHCAAAEEVEPQPAAAMVANGDYLGAVGIGVRDLKASTDFYREILDLEVLRTYELGYINEVVLGYSDGGTVLVLMNWPQDTDRRYDGSDVKNVFYVRDAKRVIERIRALGGRIDRDATPHPAVDGALVGLGRDPDDYVVEVIQRP